MLLGAEVSRMVLADYLDTPPRVPGPLLGSQDRGAQCRVRCNRLGRLTCMSLCLVVGLGIQGDTLSGTIQREDAAAVCVKAATSLRPAKGLVFEVVSTGSPAGGDSLEKIEADLKTLKEE